MQKSLQLALVAAKRIRHCPVLKLRNLAMHLGPVKAQTYRQASRIANALRAGHAVQSCDEFSRCHVVLIHTSEDGLAGVLGEMVSARLDWTGKAALTCCGPFDSEVLSELASKGAAVGSIAVVDGPGELRFLVEGDRLAVRQAKALVEGGGGRILEIRRSAQQACAAGASFASWLLTPLIHASMECFREAGLTPGRAGPIVERIMEGSLRAYLKGGRRAWKEPLSEEQRHGVLQQLESLRASNPELAAFLLETARLSLDHLGSDAAWLEDAAPPLCRAAAAGAGG